MGLHVDLLVDGEIFYSVLRDQKVEVEDYPLVLRYQIANQKTDPRVSRVKSRTVDLLIRVNASRITVPSRIAALECQLVCIGDECWWH